MITLSGSCLCKEVRYTISGDSSQFFSYTCHCRDCQYVTGGPPNSAIYIPQQVTITHGEPGCYNSKSDEGTNIRRFFCRNCGTHLYGESEKYPGTVVIKVGTLDDPGIFKSEMNVWVSSAQPWHHIDPELPRHEKGAG
ncbi:MAG: GFA family protein [Proteobacteria bacterium]|nr:GFA family protein [Pseudomonadota bacterium]